MCLSEEVDLWGLEEKREKFNKLNWEGGTGGIRVGTSKLVPSCLADNLEMNGRPPEKGLGHVLSRRQAFWDRPPNPHSPGVRGGKAGFCPGQWFCATAFALPRALFSPRAQYPCPHSHLQGKACFSVLVIHSRAVPMSVSNPAFVQGWNFRNKKGDWDLDHRKSECLPICWLVPPLAGFWPGTGSERALLWISWHLWKG